MKLNRIETKVDKCYLENNFIRWFIDFKRRITVENIAVRCQGFTKIFRVNVTSRMATINNHDSITIEEITDLLLARDS